MTIPYGLAQPLAVKPLQGRISYGLPFFLPFLAFPLWWALGISAFIWPIAAIPMALSLLLRGSHRVPRGFGVWLLFLFWMIGSTAMLSDVGRVIPFGYRAATYFAATILFLYLFNAPRALLTDRQVVMTMAVFWMVVTAGGFLGSVAPRFEFRSPMESVLPGRLANNDFVHQLIHPAAAQVSTFLGFESPRPKAPFEYTNDWGAVFALTAPFVVLSWAMVHTSLWRWAIRLFLIVSVVPVVMSLNRGLWLSLGLGFVYAGIRMAFRGRTRPLLGLVAGLSLTLMLVFLTPLRGIVEARFANPHSNESRETLYIEASNAVLHSPILGFGSPNPSDINPNLPSVGTQGQFWLVLYSHGVPGLVFYVGWYLVCLWQTRRQTSAVGFWCHIVIFISLVQLPFYGQLATQIQVTMVSAALAMRELRPPTAMVPVGSRSGAQDVAPT